MVLGVTYYRDSDSPLKNLVARLSFKKRVMEVATKSGIDGFTLVNALGAWRGKAEPSYQMYVEGIDWQKAHKLAENLRNEFNQEAVMVKDGERVEFV